MAGMKDTTLISSCCSATSHLSVNASRLALSARVHALNDCVRRSCAKAKDFRRHEKYSIGLALFGVTAVGDTEAVTAL
jgi:hypothetical protein